jgi:hypothetical protein
MQKEGKHRLMCVGTGGLCAIGVLNSVIASPPFGRGRSSLSTIDSARSISVTSRSLAHQENTSTTQLDLRPPGDSYPATIDDGAAALASRPFPSAIHHLDLGQADLGTADRIQPPTLGTGELSFRVMSQAEIFARRIHREGLLVARLWASKSALLSVGLNQKGKPGLWLTQRVH